VDGKLCQVTVAFFGANKLPKLYKPKPAKAVSSLLGSK
jgi:hypothetical protein